MSARDFELAIETDVVDAIIVSKTERGEFVASPDAPTVEAARWYFMYDGTKWENGTSIESTRELSGAVSGMSAEDFI